MEIKLNKDWRISTSSADFVVEQRRVATREVDGVEKKTGKIYRKDDTYEAWDAQGFLRTLDQALASYANHRMLQSEAKTVGELAALLKEIRAEIKAVADPSSARREDACGKD